MTSLPDCSRVPRWASHMGCINGCLSYLSIEISDAMLYGGTGHAFAINMHVEVCASGPTSWNTERIAGFGRNLGHETDAVFAPRDAPDFVAKQETTCRD